MTNFNFNFLILTLPLVLNGLLLGPFNIKLIFVQLLTLMLAEFVRQWLWMEDSNDPNLPSKKRFFFFGTIYNNSTLERFFTDRNSAISQAQPKRILLYILTYGISFVSIKFSSQFTDSNHLHLFAVSTIVSFWIFCKTTEQINRLHLVNLTMNSLFYLNQNQSRFLPFFIWFLSHFIIGFIAQKIDWKKSTSDKNILDSFSIFDLKKSLVYVVKFYVLFIIFNFALPKFDKDTETESLQSNTQNVQLSSGPQRAGTKAFEKAKLMKRSNISPETLAEMAKFKTDMENLDLSRLSVDLKNKSITMQPPQDFSTEFRRDSNYHDLQYLNEQLKKNKTLTADEIKRLNEISKNIKFEELRWKEPTDSASTAGSPDASTAGSSGSPKSNSTEDIISKYEKSVKELSSVLNKSSTSSTPERLDAIQKTLSNPDTKSKTESDLTHEYNEVRNQVSQQVDQLMSQQQKVTQLKQEMKILSIFDRINNNSVKFILLIAISISLIFLLSNRGTFGKSKKNKSSNQISLPNQVRKRLKDLYKELLKSRLSPFEEVLKSYYLVEIAMKEIEFPRTEDLPPQNYFEIVNSKFPFLGGPLKVITQLFNHVFYGEKNPSSSDIVSLRISLKELLHKLQVI